MLERYTERTRLLRQNADFAALWAADVTSTLGDRVHRVALAALVFQLTGSLAETGVAFVAAMLPDLVLGLFAGVVVDRHDRRRVMLACDLLRAPLVIALPLAAFLWLPAALAILFLVNALTIVFRPAEQALIPSVVPRGDLQEANALTQISGNLSDIAGYPLGGLIVGVLGHWLGMHAGLTSAFVLDALTFLGSAAFVATVRPRWEAPPAPARRSVWLDLREGFSFVRQSPPVRTNTLVMLLGPLTLGAETPLLIGYAWEVLERGSWGYGMLGAGISFGSILGGIWVGGHRDRLPGYIVVAGLMVMGAAIAVTAAVANLWLAVTALAVLGVGNAMVLIPSVTLVQQLTPPQLLGRVFSLRTTLIFGVLIASNAAGGWAGSVFGVRQTLAVCGALLVAGAAAAALSPSARTLQPQPPAPTGAEVFD